jgi:hypothetical protein
MEGGAQLHNKLFFLGRMSHWYFFRDYDYLQLFVRKFRPVIVSGYLLGPTWPNKNWTVQSLIWLDESYK